MKMHTVGASSRLVLFQLRRTAFTLIELLVVISVVLILVGISFKVMVGIGQKTTKANQIELMQKIKNVLACYYSANGCYPPSDTWNSGSLYRNNINQFRILRNGDPVDETDGIIFSLTTTNYPTAEDHYSSRGLLYYLYADPQASKWAKYMPVDRIRSYTDSTNTTYGSGSGVTPAGSVINNLYRFTERYHYECASSNNYQTYRLWRDPDEIPGSGDEIGFNVQD